MRCKKAQILSIAHILGDTEFTPEQYQEMEAHLAICSVCAEEYKGTKETIEFIQENKALFAQAFAKVDAEEAMKKNVLKESWRRLFAEKSGIPNILLRTGAVAACFIIGVLTWMVFSNHFKPNVLPSNSSWRQFVSASDKSFVKIELVKPAGNIDIKPNQKIIADNELKTLLINGKHKMVMNIGTNLSIEPLTINSNLGCLVKLDSGEIYTHVEHDGNPFIVQTASGKAIITGTTFNIKAKDNNTTLIVTKGCVQLQSEKGEVSVGAGQLSEIVDSAVPTKPATCDVENLTAWATGHKSNITSSQIVTNNNDNSWQPPLSSLRPEPIELNKTDYKSWVDEKREWFGKNFPWIFELKDALTKEGIEVDYPELLIQTDDIWQFMCLEKFPARFSNPDFDSLLKVALFYGFDKEWLLKNVPSAKVALARKSCQQDTITDLKAFEQLLKYAEGKEEMPYGFYIADACKYIAETRSLIWFAINTGKLNLTNTQRTEVSDLLQQEIAAACDCQNEIFYPSDEFKNLYCNKGQGNEKIIEYIKTIQTIETRIPEYEIHK